MQGLTSLVRYLATAVSMLAPGIGPQASGASPCEWVNWDPTPVVLQGAEGPVKGTPYVAPDLNLRFSDANTRSRVTPKLVEVTFSWSEPRGFRGTRSFHELLKCRPRAGELTIPGFEIMSRSWQVDWGWFESLFARNPYYVDVRITTFGESGTHTMTIRGRHLDRFRGEILHVKITESGDFEYWREAANGGAIRSDPKGGGRYRERRR